MTIYHRIREVALVNGYIIYTKTAEEGKRPMSPRVFREQVIDGLLEGVKLRASRRGRPTMSENQTV